jgi:Family of unknown function (DUF6510)
MDERIAEMRDDPAVDLTVDANAIGGMLASVFGVDMTGSSGQCAQCHTVSVVGTMRVYMRGPGVVVRCPACAQVVMRMVKTPTGMYLDASGASFVRIER